MATEFKAAVERAADAASPWDHLRAIERAVKRGEIEPGRTAEFRQRLSRARNRIPAPNNSIRDSGGRFGKLPRP